MKKVFTRPLPRIWKPLHKGIVFEADLKATRYGKLRAKLLVFDSPKSLVQFWKRRMNDGPLDGAVGVVSGLFKESYSFKNGKEENVRLLIDPRYFCAIALLKGIQTKRKNSATEYISHEAVHAAFCYEKRRKGHIFCGAEDLDEENIAYPAGRIARQINIAMTDNGLY